MLVLVAVILVVSLAALGVSLLTLREVRRAPASVSAEELAAGLKDLRQHVHREHRETRAITDALSSLGAIGPAHAPVPSTQGWAASPMVLRRLAETVTTTRPSLVVELGGGGSSVLLGRLLRDHLGGGRVVSLDHDPHWAELTREHLRRHSLEDVVEVRVAPLVEVDVDGQVFSWYDPAALADLSGVDLVFVDGPPGNTGKHARFPALPLLRGCLSPGATVILDDAARRQERAVADRWIADHGAVEVASDDVGTGWVELRVP